MLHRDPDMRPTLHRVLAHPFLAPPANPLARVPRLVAQPATYDVYVSHRRPLARGGGGGDDGAVADQLHALLAAR